MRMCDATPDTHLCGGGAVHELESQISGWFHLPHTLAVSSATAGLLGVALALDLAGCEFVTTPYTWGGSLASWLLLGCRPVFADVDPLTLTLDPESVRARITARTRAILAVDINGNPCDTAALRALADEHGLWYVADAAQSLGATRGGRPASCDADAVVLSFGTGKALDVAEGGAVVTPHEWLHQRLVWHTQHPQRQARDIGLGLINECAFNARIHPVAAHEASAAFSQALADVKERSRSGLEVLSLLEAAGLVEPSGLPGGDDVRPSFHRLSVLPVASRSEFLATEGRLWRTEPSPVGLVYRLGGFSGAHVAPGACPVAEGQAERRRVLREQACVLSESAGSDARHRS